MEDKLVDRVLGEWLNLPDSKESKICKTYSNPTQRREAYIDIYINEHPHPTWMQLTSTLRVARLHNQADEVESTYVQGSQI